MEPFIRYAILFFIIQVFISCNKVPDYSIQDPDDLIVIDGWIENGQYAKVLLTKNAPYFSLLDSTSLRELVLTRATVSLSDGERQEYLILRRNKDYFPPFIFEGNEIKGEPGKTYTITASYGGKTAIGKTSIPPPVSLDTIYFKMKENSDSLGSLWIEFTDPPDTRNYYRILSKIVGRDRRYYSAMIMGLSDESFSGKKFGFSIFRGQDSYISVNKNSYFSLGDTVNLKFCTIDKAHYEFWNSFQDEILNSGNPFASSLTVVKTNIEGDGLGIWGGYGVSFYSVVIKNAP
ncbi:MAG TPA: DUF4249 domain-containing protein [Bacteroidales bacterium]|jgi:hypothetical protein|nr:DUF4249 domain-containing protein [Bacteroidales bacterium]HOU31066.1 DUF4249 domain-containing protein [Bacteroidales bacterium]HQH23083.1 DUF4249 domain-containing protein [Bacteroidales bacterium]HQK70203.1 DUF4249 domain-containing protein [Bacteroidales bacterium]